MANALTTIYGHLASTARAHSIGTAFAFCGLAIVLRFLYNLYFYRSLARGLVSIILSTGFSILIWRTVEC